jgi:hypothetical protein
MEQIGKGLTNKLSIKKFHSQNIASLEEKYQNEIAELKVFGWDLGEESIKII